ncbi:MAG TPA: hypothetical protein VMS32_04540 [Verrucomicrobiae bacterium]|nr:hypothetical protein [Verrucomicrobiae bacterium]
MSTAPPALATLPPLTSDVWGLAALGAAFFGAAFFGTASFLGAAFFGAAFFGVAFFGVAFLGAAFFAVLLRAADFVLDFALPVALCFFFAAAMVFSLALRQAQGDNW